MPAMRSYDVVVVGAGIIGGAIALRLAQHGLRVALLDRQDPGREASWAAAGMLSPAPDTPADIPLVPFCRASLALYPDFVAEIEEISRQNTGYRREGTLEALFSGDAERKLSTLIALHHGLGLPTEPLPLDEARKLEPALGPELRAAALLPFEGSIDNRALTDAVLVAAAAQGVELFPHTSVTRLITAGARCTGVIAQQTVQAHGTVTGTGEEKSIAAGNVVLAAGAYSAKIAGVLPPSPTRPVRGQMIALRSADVRLRRVLRSEHGYLVPRGAGRDELRKNAPPQLLVAGSTLEDADFEKRVTPGGLERILSAVQEFAPALSGAEIVETWCGLRPDTPDHLPILGPGELDNLTIATGHYRNGILLAPITAKLVTQWITERRVYMDWEIFSPLRFAHTAAPENT